MNTRRFLLTVAFSTVLSAPALAATAVMVQFGSFESQEEAQARLDSVKGKYSGVLGSMPLSVREVTLPPDNLKVYRTQAGPVANRAAGQSICTQLASGGDECYVAETVIAGNAVPAAPAATSIVSAVAPVAPVVPVEPTVMAPAVISSASNNANSAVVDSAQSMNSAMDAAIAGQAAPVVATAAAPVEERSFWSRLNPFSSSKPTQTAVPAAPLVPAPIAAPVEAVSSAPVAVAVASPVAVEAATPSISIPTAPEPVVVPVVAPAPQVVQPVLPPPPAPLMAQASAAPVVTTPIIAAPAPAPVVTPTVPPVEPISVANIPFKSSPSVSSSKGEASGRGVSANGEVRVEEATRVPLTDSMTMSAQQMTPVTLYPAATLGKRTLWAQIGTFDDSQSALAFWERYKTAHPDFPAVRVRVTAPVQAAMRGNDKVWLRVGPFGQTGFISNLCSTIQHPAEGVQVPEADTQVKCGRITDMGFADTGSRAPGMLPGSRYNR